MDENKKYNPEVDEIEVSKPDLNQAFEDILSVKNDPFYLLNQMKKTFNTNTIRKALCRVGGLRELDNMKHDPHIKSAMSKRKAGIKGAKIQFNSDSDAEIEFVKNMISDSHIDFVLKNSWETWWYGYGVSELIWKRDGSDIVLDQMRQKPFHWFVPHEDLKNVHYSARHPHAIESGSVETVATYGKHLVTIQDGTYYNPQGEGDAFAIYFVSKFKEMGWNFWGEWLQKYASGFIKAAMPQGATKEEIRDARDKLEAAIRGSAMVYKNNMDLNVEWPGSDGSQFKVFRDSAVDDIFMCILGETLTSKNNSASLAATQVHYEVGKEKVDMDMEIAASGINRLIEYTYTLNMRDKKDMPRAGVYFEKGLQKERAERDAIVVGVTGKKLSADYMIREYGYKEEDFNDEDSQVFDSAVKAGADPHDCTVHFSEAEEKASKISVERDKKNQEITDYLLGVEGLGDDVEDVFAAILASETKAQLFNNLKGYFDQDSKEFEEVLTQALFAGFGEGMKQSAD